MLFPRPSPITLVAWVSVMTMRGSSAFRVQEAALGKGCEFPCGAVEVAKDDITFEIGADVKFAMQADQCLANCTVVKARMLGMFQESCSAILPGSEKVSKRDGNKLCCITTACPCEHGQGPASASFLNASVTSLKDCETLCDAEDGCKSYEYTEPPVSAFAELYSLTTNLQKKNSSCRLYRTAKLRSVADGTSKKQFCTKIGATGEQDSILQYLQEKFPCLAGQGDQSKFYQGTGDSWEGCAALCHENKDCQGFDYSSKKRPDSISLRNQDPCRLYQDNKTYIVRQYCVKTDAKTDAKMEDKFPCLAGTGEGVRSYRETGGSWERCAARCHEDEDCQGFDYSAKATGRFQPNSLNFYRDNCRLYRDNKIRHETDQIDNVRQYCAKTDAKMEGVDD